MKKTSIEWLVSQLSKEWQLEDNDLYLINQAKAMERQQIIEAFDCGDANAVHRIVQERQNTIKYGEQYYNETFKP
jgi:hypothetical protein